MPRTLRSRHRPQSERTTETNTLSPTQPIRFITPQASSDQPQQQNIPLIPPDLTRLPNLSTKETTLLRKKQSRLRASASATETIAAGYGPHAAQALSSTLIFAQHEAGTAVCIHPDGWLLTCALLRGDRSGVAIQPPQMAPLFHGRSGASRVYSLGRTTQPALARIIAFECECAAQGNLPPSFSFSFHFAYVALALAPASASLNAEIICIGQPGSDDLELSTPRKTAYDLIEISQGRLRGLIPGADPYENAEIGALRHDAWTYWGHSGAPLLRMTDGRLLGLHHRGMILRLRGRGCRLLRFGCF